MNQMAIRFSDSTEQTISVDWRVRFTAEFRLSLELEKPPLTWMSLGNSRYPLTHSFRNLEPGVEYRIVADSLGEVQEVVATTRTLRP
jgi:hypothetical protein